MEHRFIPFSGLHKAKFDGGLADDLPTSPEGLGDIYMAFDTNTLYICQADSPLAWSDYVLSDIGSGGSATPFSGVSSINASSQTIPNDTPTLLEFSTDSFDTDFYHDEGGDLTSFAIPADATYDLHLEIAFDCFANGASWDITINLNGSPMTLSSYTFDTRPVFDSGGASAWFTVSFLYFLVTGDVLTVEVRHVSGGDETVTKCRFGVAIHR